MMTYIPQNIHFENQSSYARFVHEKQPIILDIFPTLLKEQYFIDKPEVYFQTNTVQEKTWNAVLKKNTNYFKEKECFIYHAWDNKLFHILKQDDFLSLRTARHRNILTWEDQKSLYRKKIAVAGLSVGSNILLSFLRYGIGNTYHIADSDTVALSNINRAFYGVNELGKEKTVVMRDEMHNIDPFVLVTVFEKGLSQETLDAFINDVDLIVDAFDQFALKIALRKKAKERNIPVISGFDIEKGVMLIVERYDKEDIGLEIFLNNYKEDFLFSQKTIEEKTNMFINIIGKEFHSKAMLASVLSVGKKLTGYPQLIIATSLAASLFTTVAEEILLGKKCASKRIHISLPDLLV